MSFPIWLPPLFKVFPWRYDTYDLLYDIFYCDFIVNKVFLADTQSIIYIPDKKEENKEITFWHITTRENKKLGERIYDPKRCERLPWLKFILIYAHEPEVLTWENIEGDGTIKIYVWLKDYDYLAIIKKTKKERLILVTAYWVEHENMRVKLMNKYKAGTHYKKANA